MYAHFIISWPAFAAIYYTCYARIFQAVNFTKFVNYEDLFFKSFIFQFINVEPIMYLFYVHAWFSEYVHNVSEAKYPTVYSFNQIYAVFHAEFYIFISIVICKWYIVFYKVYYIEVVLSYVNWKCLKFTRNFSCTHYAICSPIRGGGWRHSRQMRSPLTMTVFGQSLFALTGFAANFTNSPPAQEDIFTAAVIIFVMYFLQIVYCGELFRIFDEKCQVDTGQPSRLSQYLWNLQLCFLTPNVSPNFSQICFLVLTLGQPNDRQDASAVLQL